MCEHPSADQLHRFIFDDADIRGEIVTLSDSFQKATEHRVLPDAAKCLLGEFLVACSLLGEVMKFTGTLTLQARGKGSIPLIMAEVNHTGHIRGVVETADASSLESSPTATLQQLLGEGVLSLTIDPEEGQRYQGIVAIEGDTLAQALSNYFQQSEQLPTRFWIQANTKVAAGFLLQGLPASATHNTAMDDAWTTAEHMADTVKTEELLHLPHDNILRRLFAEFQVRLFDPRSLCFRCRCSKDKSEQGLLSLGYDEAYQLLSEHNPITVSCDICGKTYAFDKPDLDQLFAQQQGLHH